MKFQNIDDQALLAAGDTQLSADRAVQQAMAYGLDQLMVHLQWRADVPNIVSEIDFGCWLATFVAF